MSGRHFLQIPGPTNVPERVRLAMDRAVPDHRGPELPDLTREIVSGLRRVFGSERGEIALFPGSGTAAWEATLVNTLNPGDRVLSFNIGQFSHLFAECARRMGMVVDEVELDWSGGVPASEVEDRLRSDDGHEYRALLVVHNETSTGVTSDIAAIRRAIDAVSHPALLLVDTVSGLGSLDFRFDEWGVDVALTGSQKGLMLPPGMGMVCIGERALRRSEEVTTARYFLDWRPVLNQMHAGYFPYTPATLHLFGLREALRMLQEEGLEQVFARHARLAEAVRRAVPHWGLNIFCRNPSEYSNTLTAVQVPAAADSDEVLRAAEQINLSLGTGLGRLKGRIFRIGHLGALNELEVLATLGGVELALHHCGIPIQFGRGVGAAQEFLAAAVRGAPVLAAG
ncbi:MAG TPA: aminotransferase class V-fold PLP-dependent enzyme [Candidatus Acidoferrales bacterium]|nr:aminotransferase class V-fold PLP-dependent enzyme [Candidatus Acidoferrales bacterium]